MEIEFHHFDYSRELTLQRELFRECFPETIGLSLETVDHYLWKFHSKGGASKSMEYSAYLNNKLVGYYAAIPLSYKFLDKSLKVALVCDVMTGVNARGKGVFTKLGFYSTKEIENLGLKSYSGINTDIDGIIVHTNHKEFTSILKTPFPNCKAIIDGRNLLKNIKVNNSIPIFSIGSGTN